MANLPSIPSIPANVDPQLQQVLNAMKTQLDYAQANPASSTTNAVDQAQLDTAVANAVTGITKGDTGAPGAAGSPGANGKTYVLDITGGRTSIIYDETGSSPLPAMSAFSATLYEDGVEVTPSSYSWFISDPANSLLSGTGSASSFTPTVAGAFDQAKGNNTVVLVVSYAGVSIRATEPIAITKVGATGATGATGPQGEAGTPGVDGADGTPSYFHVAYADSADGSVNFNQVAGDYIGTYVDSTPTDSAIPADYNWVLIKGSQGPTGDQGIPGTNGADGTTSYLHIKYSDDGGTTFTASGGEAVGDYIGQYVDNTLLDSTNPADYTWALIKGADGSNGKTYLLFITGGKTNAVYDTAGLNPLPTPTAFSAELYEDGVLVTPATYAWSVPATGSLLSGSSATATFTPTLATTYDINSGDNRVLLTCTYAGQTVKAVQPITITQQIASAADTSTPVAIDDLVVNGGVMYNILTWGVNPGNADHVDIYRASTKPVFEPGTLTLSGNATIVANSISKATPAVIWDTQAYSVESFTSAGAVRFKFASTILQCMAGLDASPSTSALSDTIDYAIRSYSNGTIHLWENGTDLGAFGSFVTSDLFEIEYTATSIIYKKNGSTLHTSTVTAGQTLYFDSGFYDYLSAVNSIQIGSYSDVATFSAGALTLNNTGNADTVTLTSTSITKSTARPTITKSAGSAAWDSQAYSAESYTTPCGVIFTINSALKDFAIGLDSNPTVDNSYTNIDYELNFYADGTVHVWESGMHIGAYGTYALNDVFEVSFTGTDVVYKKNGTAIYTHTGVTSGTFFVDSSYYTVGASFKNVQFGTYSGAVFSPQPLTLSTAGSVGTMTLTYPDAWDSQGYSTQSYISACAIKFSFGSTTKTAYCGLDSSPSGSADNTSIDYAWHALADGSLQIVQSGTAVTNPGTGTTNWGAYATTDVFEIEYIGTSVIFKQNGTIKHTATVSSGLTFYVDSSLYDVGASITGIQFGQYAPVSTFFPGTLTLAGNATLGADVATKPTLTVAWDEQAYSTQSIVSNGAVRFIFDSTNLAAMAGLDHDPSTSAAADTLDYAIRTYTDGTFHIFEDATDLGEFGGFQSTDVFEIEYIGTEIKYKQNDVVLYTSTVAASQTLYFDSSLYNFNVSVSAIQIGTYATYATRADATVVGSSSNRIYADYIPEGVDTVYNYWIRGVSRSGVVGDWNLVGGLVSDTGTAATPLGIGDSQVSSISATKIVAYSLAAITANLGTVTAGKMESPDGNFIVDLTAKAITIAGDNGIAADDYTLIQNGVMQFFKWTGSAHQQGASLQTIEAGEASNGSTVVLTKWYAQLPQIMVTPNDTPIYNATFSNQSQKLQVRAENKAITAGGEVSFTAVSRLVLSDSNPSFVVNEVYSGSSDTDTTTPITTVPNVTKIGCSVSFISIRGTGTVPNYYYRTVSARIAYRVSPSGTWNYTSWVATSMNNDFNTYIASLSTGTITQETYDFYVEFSAADSGGTFSSGTIAYDYIDSSALYLAADSAYVAANNTTGNSPKTLSATFPSYTPTAGYDVYQVDFVVSYGYYLHKNAAGDGISTVKNAFTGGTLHQLVTPATIGTQPPAAATNSYSYSLATAAYAPSQNLFTLTATDSVTTNFYEYAGAKAFAAGTYAVVKTRKVQANTTTPANTFTFASYALTLASSTVIDTTGTLNWQVVA